MFDLLHSVSQRCQAAMKLPLFVTQTRSPVLQLDDVLLQSLQARGQVPPLGPETLQLLLNAFTLKWETQFTKLKKNAKSSSLFF